MEFSWLHTAIGPVTAAVITFLGTNYLAKRKANQEADGQMLAGVNAATKLLIDSMFMQVAALQKELNEEKEGRRKDREEFERLIADLRQRLDEGKPHV